MSQMLQWIEKPSGKTVAHNRCELIELANRIRQHLYLLYQDIPLFLDGEECFMVEEFPLDCNCKETFLGITLPDEYETVEAIWKNDIPIKMFDKWREYRVGVQSTCPCEFAIWDIENFFPTERELSPCGSCMKVKFIAKDKADVGKTVIVRYTDSSGQEFSDEIMLSLDYVCTSREVMRIKPRGGVVLPPDLVGAVIVADGEGRILSEYPPNMVVPSYRRMKITGVCCGDQVLVKASRRFMPLYFDTDVIETDNRLAIEELARFFRYNDNTQADVQYEAKASAHAANAKFYLFGEKSRHRGKATVSSVNMSHGPINKSGLSTKQFSMNHRYGTNRYRGRSFR